MNRKELLEELFQGEGALPRPGGEEVDSLEETLEVFSRLSSPEPSGRVLEGVRSFLHHQRRMHRRARSPWRASLNMESFRAAFHGSWLVKGLAAALLAQVLALPILGAMSYWKGSSAPGKETRTGVDLEEMIDRLLPAPEEIQSEAVPGTPALGLGRGAGASPGALSPYSYRNRLVRENQLREKWFFFSTGKKTGEEKNTGPGPWRARSLERRLSALSGEIARKMKVVRDPLDLALGLRALFLSGNTEETGPFAGALKVHLPRLIGMWDRAGDSARIETAALLAEMELLDGGNRRKDLAKAVGWLIDVFSSRGERPAGVPSWALADAVQVLEWAPVLVNRNPMEKLESLREELRRRVKRGGPEGPAAAAALLRSFPESEPAERLLSMAGVLGKSKLELALEDPFLLLQVSWTSVLPSPAEKDFPRTLEKAAFQVKLLGFREKALWLLTLGACYAHRSR